MQEADLMLQPLSVKMKYDFDYGVENDEFARAGLFARAVHDDQAAEDVVSLHAAFNAPEAGAREINGDAEKLLIKVKIVQVGQDMTWLCIWPAQLSVESQQLVEHRSRRCSGVRERRGHERHHPYQRVSLDPLTKVRQKRKVR